MSFFDSLFSKSPQKQNDFPWNILTSDEQIDSLVEKSKESRIIIFKHSTRCSISSMVLNQFQNRASKDENTPFYYLDLLSYRNVSNCIAEKLQVYHQSPQAIVLKNEDVIEHASHSDILNMKNL